MTLTSRLIFVDGLPGSGKSSTAHRLALHYQSLGRSARWHYEHETPHPIYGRALIMEIMEAARERPEFFEEALEQWRQLVARGAADGQIEIFESTLLQSTLHPLLLAGMDPNRIMEYMMRIGTIVKPLSPALIWYEPDDIERALEFAIERRGEWFREFLVERVSTSPYGRSRTLNGFEGVAEYFRGYRDLVHQLMEQLGFPTLSLERGRSTQDESMKLIMDFLGESSPSDLRTSITDISAFTGRYKDVRSDDAYVVVTDGAHLYLEEGGRTLLIQRNDQSFEIEGTCVAMKFILSLDGAVDRLECTGNLPNLSRDWLRVDDGKAGEVSHD